MKDQPYLVQRIQRREHPCDARKGIDVEFEFDYMGASEFEFGTLPKTLKTIRSLAHAWAIQSVTVVVDKDSPPYTCYLVGDGSSFEAASHFFKDQLEERKVRLKEASYIRSTYKRGSDLLHGVKCDGWWALDSDPSFTLFKEKSHAELWLSFLRPTHS